MNLAELAKDDRLPVIPLRVRRPDAHAKLAFPDYGAQEFETESN